MDSAASPAALAAQAGLSTRFTVDRRHEGVYTDAAAKVVLAPSSRSFLATWCAGDVALLDLSRGALLGKVYAGSEDAEDEFLSFDVSPDEKLLATVSRRSRMIKIWNIEKMVERMKRSRDGNRPAQSARKADEDEEEVEATEMCSWKVSHTLPVLDLAFGPTGMELASASADKSIVVYSVGRKGVITHRFGPSTGATAGKQPKPSHKSRVVKIFWHPHATRAELISCAEDGEMRVWKLIDSSSILLSNHMSQVTSVAFSLDGDILISGSRDKVINVWSLAADSYGQHLRTHPVYESVEGVAILRNKPIITTPPPSSSSSSSPSSTSTAYPDLYFTTAGSKGVLRTWSLRTLDCVASKPLPSAALYASATSSGESIDSLMTRGGAGSGSGAGINQKNAEKYIANQVAHLIHMPPRARNTKEDGNDTAMDDDTETDTDGGDEERLLAVSAEQNFYIYSAQTFRRRNLLIGYNDEIIDLKTHPDNRHLFVATNSSQVRVMDLETMEADLISGHTDTVLAIDVSPCGKYIVSTSKDHTVRFWRVYLEDGDEKDKGREECSECIAIGEGHTESVGCVTFSRNAHSGKLFAASGARERIIKLWDCSVLKSHVPGTPPLRLTATTSRLAHDKDINCLELSPNDRLLASGSEDKLVRLWEPSTDLTSLTPKVVLRGHRRGVWCVRFAPVEKVLATASGDKTIKLWSVEDGNCLKTLEGHQSSVKQIAFIQAGMQLLSCGDDSVVKLWTIKTSECVGTFEDAHDGKIWSLALTPDHRRVITGGSDSILNIWRDASAEDIAEAAAERENFIIQEQQLSNLMRHGQFKQAVSMTLRLQQPRKCLNIVQDIIQRETKANVVKSDLPAIISSLDDELLNRLILYIRDWNTHAKSSHAAQVLLSHLFRTIPLSRLHSNRTLLSHLSSLSLYSQRHFARIERLLTKSYIMDHMISAMNLVEPDASVEGEERKRRAMEESRRVMEQLLSSNDASGDSSNLMLVSSRSTGVDVRMAEDDESDDEGEGGFSDDDESAWATNWTEDREEKKEQEQEQVEGEDGSEGDEQSDEEEEEEEKAPARPSKRKQPDTNNSDSTKKKHSAHQHTVTNGSHKQKQKQKKRKA